MSCIACGGNDGFAFFEQAGVLVHCNRLEQSSAEALAAPRGDVRLVLCERCLLVQNDRFDPARTRYGSGYETSLHFSGTFRDYAAAIARRLIEERGVRGRDLLEIGCGAGEFLRLLCELGGNRGVGVDPVHAGLLERPPGGGSLRIVGAEFGPDWPAACADLVVARQVLEHTAEPIALLRCLRRVLRARADSLAYVEVPNALWTLREGGIFDVIYEHCAYYTAEALSAALGRAGLRSLGVEETFGGQFLAVEARLGPDQAGAPAGAARRAELRGLCERFAALHREELAAWRQRLGELERAGRRAVLWGAGAKGVTFLNALGAGTGAIAGVVDQNPRKHGRHVSGCGLPVRAPESLGAEPPDAVVLLNPVYRGEVAAALEALGIAAEVLVPRARG